MLYKIIYYARLAGTQPVGEWLDSLSIQHQAVVMAKIQALEENGLVLLGTKMLSVIKGGDKDFYELRGGQCRVALYFNRSQNTFVLLHGFLKKKQNERSEIKKARSLLQEYLG
jgi:phage-related protein